MSRIPLKDRKAWLLKLPFISRVRKPSRCIEYRWSHVPLAMLYSKDDARRAELREKYRCKKIGHYRFTARKPRSKDPVDHWAYGTSGEYCWEHLMNQINYRPKERQRLDKHLAQNPPYWYKTTEENRGQEQEQPGRSSEQRGGGEERQAE